jgi:hypothetical protein
LSPQVFDKILGGDGAAMAKAPAVARFPGAAAGDVALPIDKLINR